MVEKELKKKQHRLYVICCVLVFMLFLGYTIIWEIDYHKKYGHFKRVRCEVVEHVEEDGETYDVFTFQTDKQVWVKKTTPFKSKYDIGDKFYAYYDTETEIEMIYNIDDRKIILPIITGMFGLATCGVIALYLITYRKNKVKGDDNKSNKKSKTK